jgi:ubiquinone/menaquinone biosynthesis C-methylase UbiE
MSDLRLLDETQNQAFDTDYHNPRELEEKLVRIAGYFMKPTLSFLDLGGGNGHFLDVLLNRFPRATGVLVDVSETLLRQNQPHPRKQLVKASVDQLPFGIKSTFDVITVNWLLHHLVGSSYQQSHSNAVNLLWKCKYLLSKRGVIVVTENMFEGILYSNLPSHLIFAITSTRVPWFAKLARRAFNTAGVGVCFNSHRAWRRIFHDAGLMIVQEQHGIVWQKPPLETAAMHCLGLTQVSTRHFYLQPAHGLEHGDWLTVA